MRKATIIILPTVILIGVCFIILHWYCAKTFGGYNPNSSRDVQKLLVIADKSHPLRDALEQFKHDHGSYPTNIDNLFPSYLQAPPEPDPVGWKHWSYERQSTNEYSLDYQTGWDDELCYEHSASGTDRWYYSGSLEPTDLTKKFLHK